MAGGRAWLWGSVWQGGACMAGGMRGGGCAWQGGIRGSYYEIRSMSGRNLGRFTGHTQS